MFSGYIPAVVTPFKDNNVDLSAFSKYINWLTESGMKQVVVCGSTGEAISLSLEEKTSLISEAVKINDGVIGGIISAITEDCTVQAKAYENAGAIALLCVCPYYVKPTQDGIYAHFKRIHDSTSLPIIIYNNPGRVGVDISGDTIRKLANLERIVGLKEASSDLSRFLCWRQNVKSEFTFLSGNDDTACGALALGGHGAISVTANLLPDVCVSIYRAWTDKNLDKFFVLRDKLKNIHGLLFAEPSPAPLKYALSLRGIMLEDVRSPLMPISESLKNRIKLEMEGLQIL